MLPSFHVYLSRSTLSHIPLLRCQCTWGRETAKKARTQQHFESLVNHIKSLEHRVKELEAEVAQPNKSSSTSARRSDSVSDAARSAASSSLSPHPSPVAKFEPDEDRFPEENDEDSSGQSDADSEIDQLIAPTRHLVVRPQLYFSPGTTDPVTPSHLVTRRGLGTVRPYFSVSSGPRTFQGQPRGR